MYGISTTAGASEKTPESAAAGTTSSFWMNLTPSATNCAHPWNAPASIGPSRACMCARTLCSMYPTASGTTRNTPRTMAAFRTSATQ
jgi:hypothetical protein